MSGYSVVHNGSTYLKLDSSGNYSTINSLCLTVINSKSDNKVSLRQNVYPDDSRYSVFAKDIGPDFVSDNAYAFPYLDLSCVFKSKSDYVNSLDLASVVAGGDYLVGDDDSAKADDSNIYVPDLSWYEDNAFKIGQVLTNQDDLLKQLELTQAAYTKALEDINDSIEEGNATTASLLQKILDAVLALPTSIISNVSVDVSAIKSLISSVDTSISDSLPIIQDVAANGALTVEKVNELVDAINDALEKNGIIGGVNERVDGIAEDVDALTKAISGVIEGTDSISVSVDRPVYRNNQEEPEYNFNNGFFGILFFLFSLFFKILQLLFDCLMFLFTLHNVKASPYFLNDDMIQGLNWMKKIGIKGDLLNVSLYQFLFVLVRIVIVFSVVKLIRKWVNKL